MNKISVILNLYKRPNIFKEQYEAIMRQTVQPYEILVWSNAEQIKDFDEEILKKCTVAASNKNLGVFARYAMALNSTGNYIAVFDDDSIPNPKFFEYCLKEQEKEKCVLCSVGIQFDDLSYGPGRYMRFGWPALNNEKVEVDFGGHVSFFGREVLGEYWKDSYIPESYISGEDIRLSWAAQKLGYKTYASAHPEAEPEIWGCVPWKSMRYGVDENAISVNYHGTHFAARLEEYYKKGFKFLKF